MKTKEQIRLLSKMVEGIEKLQTTDFEPDEIVKQINWEILQRMRENIEITIKAIQ